MLKLVLTTKTASMTSHSNQHQNKIEYMQQTIGENLASGSIILFAREVKFNDKWCTVGVLVRIIVVIDRIVSVKLLKKV